MTGWTQWWPGFLAAIAAFIGALVAWLGPYRNAQIERDNRLRALYGDIVKEMLAINADVCEVLFALAITHRLPSAYVSSPGEVEERRVHRKAFEDAYALLLVEPYPVVASVIAAGDAYRIEVEALEVDPAGDPADFDRLLREAQYAMVRSPYARGPWGRLQLWWAFHSRVTRTGAK